MKILYYRQCKLQRGSSFTTTWLPEKFAKLGKYLQLKEENGWRIILVGDTRLPEEIVNRNSQNYKHQREFSDI